MSKLQLMNLKSLFLRKQEFRKKIIISILLFVIPTKAGDRRLGRFQTGFTLVELTVALGIFAAVMAVSMGILLDSLKTSRHVASQARAIDNISLAMEQIAREIRTGSGIDMSQSGLVNQISFINHRGQRTVYSFCGTRMCRDGRHITTENVVITGGFIITNFGGNKTPRITVAARATDTRGNIFGSIQTTISARLIHYKTPR